MLGTSSSAFEGIFKEHFTILLAHVEQNSAVVNLVSAVKNGPLSVGGGLVKSKPLTLLCHWLRNPQNQDYATMNAFSTCGSEICPLNGITFLIYLFMLQSSIFKPLWMSGYDHVEHSEERRKYFGLQWQHWYFVYNTIPFGWKGSAYVYHSIGMAATSYIRSLGVHWWPSYWAAFSLPWMLPSVGDWSELEFANAAIFIAAFVLISLGYFIGLSKSSLIPAQVVRFLGFLCLPFDRGSEY